MGQSAVGDVFEKNIFKSCEEVSRRKATVSKTFVELLLGKGRYVSGEEHTMFKLDAVEWED